jgi:hypothetical protein
VVAVPQPQPVPQELQPQPVPLEPQQQHQPVREIVTAVPVTGMGQIIPCVVILRAAGAGVTVDATGLVYLRVPVIPNPGAGVAQQPPRALHLQQPPRALHLQQPPRALDLQQPPRALDLQQLQALAAVEVHAAVAQIFLPHLRRMVLVIIAGF